AGNESQASLTLFYLQSDRSCAERAHLPLGTVCTSRCPPCEGSSGKRQQCRKTLQHITRLGVFQTSQETRAEQNEGYQDSAGGSQSPGEPAPQGRCNVEHVEPCPQQRESAFFGMM